MENENKTITTITQDDLFDQVDDLRFREGYTHNNDQYRNEEMTAKITEFFREKFGDKTEIPLIDPKDVWNEFVEWCDLEFLEYYQAQHPDCDPTWLVQGGRFKCALGADDDCPPDLEEEDCGHCWDCPFRDDCEDWFPDPSGIRDSYLIN